MEHFFPLESVERIVLILLPVFLFPFSICAKHVFEIKFLEYLFAADLKEKLKE